MSDHHTGPDGVELGILFLGASKRVSLLERFMDAGARIGAHLRLYSCEADNCFYPISHLASVLKGPSFLAPEFKLWLEGITRQYRINLIIPNLDSATVALSRYAVGRPRTAECWPVVSDLSLCEVMFDKIRSRAVFAEMGLPVLPNTPGKYPKIAKPQFGCGARGIRVLTSEADGESLASQFAGTRYLVEDFLSDVVETTVDFCVSPRKGLLGYVLRDRLEVSDGEVMMCKTRSPRPNEARLIEQAASLPGWVGCVTLQYLTDRDDHLYIVEINPRFGGGCTCAIEAGLDMPYYLMAEMLEIDFRPPAQFRNLCMTRARRDFFREF
jgi:carbamoyl-phosphate synthase large subunit